MWHSGMFVDKVLNNTGFDHSDGDVIDAHNLTSIQLFMG